MKTTIKISILFLITMLALASCSMEKRIYSSGYFFEWKNSKTLLKKKEAVNEKTIKNIEVEKTDISKDEAFDMDTTILNEPIIASTDNKQVSLLLNGKKDVFSSRTEKSMNNTCQNKTFNKPLLKKKTKTTLLYEDNPEYNRMALLGFISFIIGHLGFFIPFAGVFWILGVIFSIVALSQLKQDPIKRGKDLAKAVVIIAAIEVILALFLILIFICLLLLSDGSFNLYGG